MQEDRGVHFSELRAAQAEQSALYPRHAALPLRPVEVLRESKGRACFLVTCGAGDARCVLKAGDGQIGAEYDALNELGGGLREVLPRAVAHWQEGERHYLLREWIPGQTLEEIVRAEAPMDVQRVTALALAVADALAAVHRAGLVYRDLKPENAVITADGRCMLFDAETLRRYAPDKARDTVNLGTRQFASPEQLCDRQTDGRSDMYSFGMLLLYLLRGSVRPEDAEGLPGRLGRVVRRCIAFDPKRRYASDGALHRALTGRRYAPAAWAAVAVAMLFGLGWWLGGGQSGVSAHTFADAVVVTQAAKDGWSFRDAAHSLWTDALCFRLREGAMADAAVTAEIAEGGDTAEVRVCREGEGYAVQVRALQAGTATVRVRIATAEAALMQELPVNVHALPEDTVLPDALTLTADRVQASVGEPIPLPAPADAEGWTWQVSLTDGAGQPVQLNEQGALTEPGVYQALVTARRVRNVGLTASCVVMVGEELDFDRLLDQTNMCYGDDHWRTASAAVDGNHLMQLTLREALTWADVTLSCTVLGEDMGWVEQRNVTERGCTLWFRPSQAGDAVVLVSARTAEGTAYRLLPLHVTGLESALPDHPMAYPQTVAGVAGKPIPLPTMVFAEETGDAGEAVRQGWNRSLRIAGADQYNRYDFADDAVVIDEPGEYTATLILSYHYNLSYQATFRMVVQADAAAEASPADGAALQALLDAAEGDTAIRLSDTMTLTEPLRVPQGRVTLRGTGTLTGGRADQPLIEVAEGATLTLYAGVTVAGTSGGELIRSAGTLILQGGTVELSGGNGDRTAVCNAGGTVRLLDGRIWVDGGGLAEGCRALMIDNNGGYVTVEGGSCVVERGGTGSGGILNRGLCDMKGGSITASAGAGAPFSIDSAQGGSLRYQTGYLHPAAVP